MKKFASSPLYSNAPDRPAPGGSPQVQAHSLLLAGIFLPASPGITSSDRAGFQGYNLFPNPVPKTARGENTKVLPFVPIWGNSKGEIPV